jgi:predicted CXXCH cytochrome family protein
LPRRRLTIGVGLAGLALAALWLSAGGASATPAAPAPLAQGVDNETCLACHAQPDMRTTLPSNEELFLTIDRDVYNSSVHGEGGYACVQCHVGYTGFPHEPIQAQTRRAYSVQQAASCSRCHEQQHEQTLVNAHGQAQAAGQVEAAVCTDCHGAHNVESFKEKPRSAIPQTCQKCHSEIYALYEDSVHGAALIGEGNPDVPACTDCHGTHTVEGPSSTERFRLLSPEICAQCHADKELMAKYGISTEVFETYLSDFHGKTVLFQASIPGQETNKPVCIDCHSVHHILAPANPASTVNIQQNLLTTCQKCHPGAQENFPAAWLGHYAPSQENAPLVYFVNLFYQIFIPSVLGVMVVFVATDAVRRILNRRKGQGHE